MSDNPFRQEHDFAKRDRAVRDSIRRKAATRPRTDANGTRLDHDFYRYDEFGALVGKVDPRTGKVVKTADDDPPAA
jgi:hypothetical protein